MTRLSDAKCTEELSHLVNSFIKTVHDAIIKLKWISDTKPFAMMEEAWSGSKGIPMKFRNI
jgi:hypothetical protein